MKLSVFCGFISIILYALIMATNTFFPGDLTVDQQFNSTVVAAVSAFAGLGLLAYSKRKGYNIL